MAIVADKGISAKKPASKSFNISQTPFYNPSASPATVASLSTRAGVPGNQGYGVIGNTPKRTTAPSGGGGGGGYQAPRSGGGGGGGGTQTPFGTTLPAPAVTPPSEEEFAANDSILQAALGALDRAMKDYTAQYDVDVSNYDRDYNRGLGDLGWRDQDPGEAQNMGWDWNDVLTASGRGFKNTNDDFASRGMLQSSGYADALRLLERSLNDQKGGMDTARTDFMGDLGRRKAEFSNQDTLSRQQARAESASRRAAQYGIV